MSEAGGSNIEIAQHLSDHKGSAHSLGHEILEIAEAVVLAVVAITTAWSGYQSDDIGSNHPLVGSIFSGPGAWATTLLTSPARCCLCTPIGHLCLVQPRLIKGNIEVRRYRDASTQFAVVDG